MTDIIISEFMDEASVERMRTQYSVLYDPALVDDRTRLIGALGAARAIVVRNRTQVNAELLAAAPDLAVVGRLGVGLDNIDLDACAARDVAVKPAIGANNVAVAEYVLAAALTLVRGAYQATDRVVAGDWPRQALIGGELSGRTLGLVGYGGIARETARRAQAFDMSVIAHDPHLSEGDAAWGETRPVALETLLRTADIVSLHVPLTQGTHHIIDAQAIAAMKPDAIVINAARGGVVDEPALAAALRDNRLGGAALDVFESEPLSAQAGTIFAGVPNLILTPHIAGVTDESNVRVSAVTADNVLAVLAEGA